MAYTWHAVDLLSGRRGPQLQTQARGQLSRIIGESTDLSASVLMWDQERGGAVPEWRQWTQPGRMMMLCVDDDDNPIWGGVILRRIPNEGIWCPVTAATLEHYLDRRYSGSLNFVGSDQAFIMQTLVQATVSTSGIPFIIDAPASGTLRDRSYPDEEDKTTLSLLTDLMNVQGGLEFTVDLQWSDASHTVLQYVFRARARIGTALAQPVRFEMPGPVSKFDLVEDYTKDYGANDDMAVSSGEGAARPSSGHQVASDLLTAGWPRYERRWTPSTSISETATLVSYAQQDLTRKKTGLTELSLVANLDTAPRLNQDWFLGDDITAAITSPAFPTRRTRDGLQAPGYERTVRVVGWEINLDDRTLTPTVRDNGAPVTEELPLYTGGTEPQPNNNSYNTDTVYGTVLGGV